ncbi:MAG TPA: M48 family metallopeptidase [Nocardioides sp.]|nr:M48 family metallopeptidase [Nocardioides sp.]
MDVEVRRSRRRRRTVQAYRDGDRIVVLVPDSLTKAEERDWVAKMVQQVERREQRGSLTSDADLLRRADELNDLYFGGMAAPVSVRWVGNQRARWGSCNPGDRTIRLSERLKGLPEWVVDYVIVHELAHLLEPRHTKAFWAWVAHYPQAEKAKGYLLGYSEAARMKPPADDGDDAVD